MKICLFNGYVHLCSNFNLKHYGFSSICIQNTYVHQISNINCLRDAIFSTSRSSCKSFASFACDFHFVLFKAHAHG